MKQVEIKVLNETGLHARPASILTKTASSFSSELRIKKGEMTADVKSIINLLSLGLKKGDAIILEANGDDEDIAIQSIVDLFNTGFGDLHG
jgi:phosphocarrier protein